MTIIEREASSSPLKSIVLWLGGFHVLMSFLGAVGHLMAGSGLEEILEFVYAPNAVPKCLKESSQQGHSRSFPGWWSTEHSTGRENFWSQTAHSQQAVL